MDSFLGIRVKICSDCHILDKRSLNSPIFGYGNLILRPKLIDIMVDDYTNHHLILLLLSFCNVQQNRRR